MTWKDDYQDGSFRGVPIKVRVSSSGGGRRLAVHQFPRKEETEHEDLGLKDVAFRLSGYVLGDDYNIQRDNLEAALSAYGPGRLILPLRGSILVSVDTYQINESADRGGAAFFSVSVFKEPDDSPVTKKDNKRSIDLARESTVVAATDDLDENYSLDNKASSVISDARSTIDKALSIMQAAKRSAASAAEFKRAADTARGKIIQLSLAPRSLAFTFNGLISFGVDDPGQLVEGYSFKDQLREQRQMFDTTREPLVSTPSGISLDKDYPARQIQTFMAYSIVSSMAGLINRSEFDSVSEATEEQNNLFDLIDELSEEEDIDDGIYAGLRDIRASVYSYIQDDRINLPMLFDYTPEQGDNVISLAYRIYGDINEADAIIERNDIVHPGFIPVAQSLLLRVDDE